MKKVIFVIGIIIFGIGLTGQLAVSNEIGSLNNKVTQCNSLLGQLDTLFSSQDRARCQVALNTGVLLEGLYPVTHMIMYFGLGIIVLGSAIWIGYDVTKWRQNRVK